MWEFEHSEEGNASRGALWALYSDVTTWPDWDKGIEWIRLDGEFREGASGTIKPLGQDQLPFRLTKVVVDGGFSDETEVPGAGVTVGFRHTIESLGEGRCRITHRVSIFGPGADSLAPEMGPEMAKGIPETMRSLLRMARERRG
ncbi:MAG TPA: hypothetical protein VLU99_08215 [Nitrososphaerales archaeon]|nr:hypothetical protein [Nitrososphaerales archaeon]